MTPGTAVPLVPAASPGPHPLAAAFDQAALAPLYVFPAAAVFALAAAFFVSAEVAVARAAGMTGDLADDDRPGTRRLRAVLAEPAGHLNMVLLLRVFCEVVAAVALTVGFAGWLGAGWPAVVSAVLVMSVVDFVLVGVTPRILGRQFAPALAGASVTVLAPVAPLLRPLTHTLVRLGRALTPRTIGDREGPFTSESELRRLVDLAERGHVIDADERQMIHSVFKLDDTSVREVMVPRTDIVFVERDASLDDGLTLALRSGFSRIPVLGADEDDVVGVVYLKDLVARIRRDWAREEDGGAARGAAAGGDPAATVETVMRAPTFVPDSKPIDELLRDMQQRRIHVAVVIDEYGGTAGLVTIEDIVEEIVGEITDEYDDEIPPIERLGEGRARVTARLPLGELAELFGAELDVPEVETVGGLLAYALGRVPITGSQAVYAGLRLTAEDTVGRRNQTATVLVEAVAPQPDEGR